MTLKEIREDHVKKNWKENNLSFQEMIIKSIEVIEIHKFKRKGKIDYAFSNETVEI
ncbi:hypothetical protein AB4552_10185 [Vibrio sp. 10N.222.54.C3]|uniref:hypothetical protein n=1 Tax=Vibrio TaxID=662 RepID=UPI0015E755D6|nr:hypothetical protein [Vibrio splendidus]CAK2141561.1 hypothetical protein VCRA2118O236_40253 [Vibrio crassostreae]CAK3224090.1 hypothetical protein VCRA2128O309_240003 [Vibrio crassostreae]